MKKGFIFDYFLKENKYFAYSYLSFYLQIAFIFFVNLIRLPYTLHSRMIFRVLCAVINSQQLFGTAKKHFVSLSVKSF